jgi:chemotaxis family two-component system sensor kinase Cph1
MSAAKSDLSRLAELAGGLKLHEHRCLIYDTEEAQLAAALPYLRTSLDRGERCLYVADESSAPTVLDALRRSGPDVDWYVKSGTLIIAGKQETRLNQS